MVVAPFDERAYRGRRRVKDCHLVLFDDLPEAAFIGIVRRAFVHDDRSTGGEWSVDNITVARNPADVGCAPEDVIITMVENPLEGFLDEQVVAGSGVLDAFGF